ncbi:hypothetical protein ACRAWF_36450 [Streptomyces sp. L7]
MLYTCLPLFHTNALTTLTQAMAVGARLCVDELGSPALGTGSAVAGTGATVVYLLGAMVPMLLAGRRARRPRHQPRRALSRPIRGPRAAFRERFGVTLVDGVRDPRRRTS